MLYVRPYTRAGSRPPTLVTEVDAGVRTSTSTLVQQPTAFARLYVPEETQGRALLDSGGAVDRWTAMAVKLGDDLRGSTHTVSVRATSPDGSPVYVRLLSTWEE